MHKDKYISEDIAVTNISNNTMYISGEFLTDNNKFNYYQNNASKECRTIKIAKFKSGDTLLFRKSAIEKYSKDNNCFNIFNYYIRNKMWSVGDCNKYKRELLNRKAEKGDLTKRPPIRNIDIKEKVIKYKQPTTLNKGNGKSFIME